jgi:hypothetical protein
MYASKRRILRVHIITSIFVSELNTVFELNKVVITSPTKVKKVMSDDMRHKRSN